MRQRMMVATPDVIFPAMTETELQARLIAGGIAACVALGIVLLVEVIARACARTPTSRIIVRLLLRLFRLIATPIAVLLILQEAGVLENVWALVSAVFALVAIGFVAVWSVLSNTLCTVLLLLAKPFKVGDQIEFAGETVKGRVVDLDLMFTTLRADDGRFIQVPNNAFFQKTILRRPGRLDVPLEEQFEAAAPLSTTRPREEQPA